MKLRTSFFNLAVLKKDIRRFAPVWGIYSVFVFFNFLSVSIVDIFYGNRALSFFFSAIDFSTMNAPFYACVCAMLLFGDLYKPRLCNALHAMPIRRESWLLTHSVAGIMFMFMPNTVIALMGSIILDGQWYIAFLWLAVSLMQYLTFFGMAVFCVMCAGSKLGMAICYAILNFGPYLLVGVAEAFYSSSLYGVEFDTSIVDWATPIAVLMNCRYLNTESVGNGESILIGFAGMDFLYTGLLVAIGALFLAAAVMLYRRRNLETAGDFMAWRPAAVVFQLMFCLLVGYTFCSGGELAAGFIGIVIGFFGGQMLLERKVNVFRKRVFKCCGLFLGVMILTVAINATDPLGLVTKLPDAQEVKSVAIRGGYKFGAKSTVVETDTPEGIAAVIQIQKQLVQEKPDTNAYPLLAFEYEMKDGSTFKRYYPVGTEDLDRSQLSQCYTGWQLVFDTHDWAELCDRVVLARIDSPADGGKTVIYSSDQELLQNVPEGLRVEPLEGDNIKDLLRVMIQEYEEGESPRFGDGEISNIDGYCIQIVTRENGTCKTRWYIIPQSWTVTVDMIENCF